MTIRLSQTVDFNKWSTQKLVGRTNIADCLKAMISRSDNTCGEAMGNYLGWQKAENSAHVAGFTETRMGSDLIGSAHDTALYLQQLQAGKLFNQQITDLVLSSMSQQKYRSGIPSGCPSCTVLNKTGNYGAYNHDAAIVTNGNHKYIFVVFSQGASYAKIAELSQLVNSELAKP